MGVAEGAFAARTAARRAVDGPLIVRAGATPAFLADLPVAQLRADDARREELVDLLERLGLRTLGAFAALDPADVAGRFGAAGLDAWRLAWGDDDVPTEAVAPPADLRAIRELDPPADRVDAAAFVVRGLAEEFHSALTRRGLACESVVVIAETEHGERIERCWRHEGVLSATGVAQRLRWQLEGWLSGRGAGGSPAHRVPLAERLQGGVVRLELVPDRVVAATGRQLGFWGGRDSAAERARRRRAHVGGGGGPGARGGRGARSLRHPPRRWERTHRWRSPLWRRRWRSALTRRWRCDGSLGGYRRAGSSMAGPAAGAGAGGDPRSAAADPADRRRGSAGRGERPGWAERAAPGGRCGWGAGGDHGLGGAMARRRAVVGCHRGPSSGAHPGGDRRRRGPPLRPRSRGLGHRGNLRLRSN